MNIMGKITFFILFFFIVYLQATEVVATVNGENVTEEDVNSYVVKSLPGASYYVLTKEQKKAAVNTMVDRKLFLEDAKRIQIEYDPEFKLKLKRLKENLMLDTWMQKKVEEIYISDFEARRFYNNNTSKFLQEASVKVRHILVSTKLKAEMIISKLERYQPILKEKFIELAKIESIGPSSTNGGEMDWFIEEQMVPEFSMVAFSLERNTITKEPVLTQFGYHVIYLEARREKGLLPFISVKPDIVNTLQRIKFKTKLDNLRKTLRKPARISVK